jgi:predicted Fe-Mo cluster-binding NifX family protein
MKLIIASSGPDPADRVDPRFGRAPYLMQYDSSDESLVALDNSAQAALAQGAGVQSAQTVVGLGAEAVLTGRCGPKAFRILSESGVTVYSGCTGSVQDAIEAWHDGRLEALTAPNGRAHH